MSTFATHVAFVGASWTRAIFGLRSGFRRSPKEGINIGDPNFAGEEIHPQRLREAEVAWRPLISNCQGSACEIVERTDDSPSKVWKTLKTHFEPDIMSKKQKLHRNFKFNMAIIPGVRFRAGVPVQAWKVSCRG